MIRNLTLGSASYLEIRLCSIFLATSIFCTATGALAQVNISSKETHFIVPAEQLSSQDLWPFRRHAGIVNNRHPLWTDYAAALTRFPSTQSCLLPTTGKQSRWDLAEFDWLSMRNHRDIEVCLFRVADSLGEPKRMEDWLVVQGYKTMGPLKLITDDRSRPETDGWVGLYPCLDSKIFEKRVSFKANLLREILESLLPRGAPHKRDHCMILEYSKSGKITAIQSLRRGG